MSYGSNNNLPSAVKIAAENAMVEELSLEGSSISDSEDNFEFKIKKDATNVKLAPIPINLNDRLPETKPIPVQPSRPPPSPVKAYPADRKVHPESSSPSPQEQEFGSPSKLNRSDSFGSAGSPTKTRFRKRIKKGYELASYDRAVEYLHTRSYRRKAGVAAEGEDDQYEPLPGCAGTQDLKQFGLGAYLYFQFIKRLAVTMFLCSVVLIFPLITFYPGTGLSEYTESKSFTMTIARFTLGNLQNAGRRDYMLVTIPDLVSVIIMIIFYIHWRRFHNATIEEMEKDLKILDPSKYAVSIEAFWDESNNNKHLQAELKGYIDTKYKGAYEVEIVHDYKGNFDMFMDYDEQIQAVEKEHQVLKQTDKGPQDLVEEEKKLNQIENQIKHISQSFEPMYAIIHFRTLKSKFSFLNYCRHFKLQTGALASFQRCILCTPDPPKDQLFQGKFPLMIRNNKLSQPNQINWRNADLSACSSFSRWILSICLVTLCIIITSGVIALCMLYVSSTSSCQKVTLPSTSLSTTDQIAQVKTMDDTAHFCYCNANLANMATDVQINEFCQSQSTKVLIANALQVVASILAAITNVLLAIVVMVLASKLLRPLSIPQQYKFVFWGVLIATWINSAIIPLLLNGNVFGTEFVAYLKFIDFIDYDNVSIFQDFDTDWYAIVSPYYTTMLIIAAFVSPIAGTILFAVKSCFKHWRVSSKCQNTNKEKPYIQKEANSDISSIEWQFAIEKAQVALFLFISFLYSGLIPLLVPIYALGLIWMFLMKRIMLVKYCIIVPADETLSNSMIFFLPFVILAHGLFAVWSHTVPGVFTQEAPLIRFDISVFSGKIDRVFNDALILAEPALIILLRLLELTIFNFIGCLTDCCSKSDLEMPACFAAIENTQFSERLQRANILGSYKVANSPQYGHALKAFNELMHRTKQDMEESEDGLNVENFA